MGPLAKNSPLLVTHVWSGLFLAGWDGTLLTWLYAQMSAIIGHPLLARSWVGSLTPLQGAYHVPALRGSTSFAGNGAPLATAEGAPGLARELKRPVIWIWRLGVGEQLTWFRQLLSAK